MTETLLQTKFYTPLAQPTVIQRLPLVDKLNAGQRCKLSLVSAPAGFGKTTLVSLWLQADAAAGAAWLSLDEQDNHLQRFWTYVIAALQTAVPHLATTAQTSLQSDSQTAIEPVLVSLLNDIAAHSQRILLVLDDLHTIIQPEIYESLDFFLDHQPPNLHLVIVTREDPPLHLSRLRVRGQLCEIRAADLRFSVDETAVFLNDQLNLNCAKEAISTLNQHTEGWAAGLQLAALALQSSGAKASPSEFVAAFSGSDRFLADYLIDEVLLRQETAVQHFLQRTSILSQFNAELCDAILETNKWQVVGGKSHDILDHLERANLFLVPLDNERRWYRYHHLFAEFLQQRLHEAEPAQIPRLHQAAAQWLADNDRPREALPYALAAADYSLAAELIESIAPQILEQEDAVIVQKWIEKLPENLLTQRPFLCLAYAWALTVTGTSGDIDNYLETAVSLSQQAAPAKQKIITGHVAAHQAYAAMFAGAHEEAGDFAQQALAALPLKRRALRARTVAVLGNSHNYAGQLTEALHAYGDAAAWCEQGGDVANATFNLCSLAEIYLDKAQLSRAAQTYQQVLDFALRHTGSTDNPFTGFAHCAMGRVARERNELDTAVTHLQRGISLCREWQQAYSLAIGLLDMGMLWTAQGEWERAHAVLQEARLLAQAASPVWGVGMVDALLARWALARGDVDAALQWATVCGFAPVDEPTYELTIVNFTLARVLNAQNCFAEALTLLTKIERLHKPVGRQRLVLEAAIWQAVANTAKGEKAQAITQLKTALSLAQPEGYVRVFLDAGQPIAHLLTEIPSSPFQQQLLGAFGLETAVTPTVQSQLLDPLNERELAILRLMGAGLSNRDIGDELFLSVNTIRWYASQIYSKMGVSGRGTAVAYARELGLLP